MESILLALRWTGSIGLLGWFLFTATNDNVTAPPYVTPAQDAQAPSAVDTKPESAAPLPFSAAIGAANTGIIPDSTIQDILALRARFGSGVGTQEEFQAAIETLSLSGLEASECDSELSRSQFAKVSGVCDLTTSCGFGDVPNSEQEVLVADALPLTWHPMTQQRTVAGPNQEVGGEWSQLVAARVQFLQMADNQPPTIASVPVHPQPHFMQQHPNFTPQQPHFTPQQASFAPQQAMFVPSQPQQVSSAGSPMFATSNESPVRVAAPGLLLPHQATQVVHPYGHPTHPANAIHPAHPTQPAGPPFQSMQVASLAPYPNPAPLRANESGASRTSILRTVARRLEEAAWELEAVTEYALADQLRQQAAAIYQQAR